MADTGAVETDWAWWARSVRCGEAAFLVGAGVSADAPSHLPLATGLVAHLVRPLLEATQLSSELGDSVLTELTLVRPEVIGDVLIEHLGKPALLPLDAGLRSKPNGWHTLLATALRKGCNVVTPNFDLLIEEVSAGGAPLRVTTSEEAARVVSTVREPSGLLFKIHGSLPDVPSASAFRSLALALRQVGTGLPRPMTQALAAAIGNRPLIVLGYAGRDDFDIVPALRQLPRNAPTLWIVHDATTPLRPIGSDDVGWMPADAALHCCANWAGDLFMLRGPTASALPLLGGCRRARVRLKTSQPSRQTSRSRARVKQTQALVYCLVETRASGLALAVVEEALQRLPKRSAGVVALMRDKAVVLEKSGEDLKVAQRAADRAIAAAEKLRPQRPAMLALALDQRGVLARRRGLHRHAERFYARALRVLKTKRPAWLYMMIRAHRAVALDYLKRHRLALREHQAVAAFERRHGDLRGLCKSLGNIGIVYESLDKPDRAIDHFKQSIALKEQLGDSRGIAQTLHNLGRLHYFRERYDEAHSAFVESHRLREGLGRDQHGVAQSLIALGRVAEKREHFGAARAYALQALQRMHAFHDNRGVAMALAALKDLDAPACLSENDSVTDIGNCIYCSSTEPRANREHVVSQALGTFEQSWTLGCVCDSCNQFFGDNFELVLGRDSAESVLRVIAGVKPLSDIEKLLNRHVTFVLDEPGELQGILLRMRAGDSGIVPTPTPQVAFRSEGGPWLYVLERDLNAEAVSKLSGPSVEIKVLGQEADGDLERLRQKLASLGLEFAEDRRAIGLEMSPSGDPVSVVHEFVITDTHRRAAAKVCFNYLAKTLGAEVARLPAFDAIRRFIRYGDEGGTKLVSAQRLSVLSGDGADTSRTHAIGFQWEEPRRELIGLVTLFNEMTYGIRLCHSMTDEWVSVRRRHFFDAISRRISEMPAREN